MLSENLVSPLKDLEKQLLDFRQGIEKEGLRIDEKGFFSEYAHDKRLGHKLTHPYITTDYSENLLEIITPVFNSNARLLSFLSQAHKYVYEHTEGSELIWSASMPATLSKSSDDIKLAYYGESFQGKLKTLYRKGLGLRYGRSMQTIAGLHYNFSLSPELVKNLYFCLKKISPHQKIEAGELQSFQDELYFKLIRNFKRFSYILPLLFGASPVVDESFLYNRDHSLQKIGYKTWGKEYATCLRMGDLGYTSKAQRDISICYNKLDTYIETIEAARLRSYSEYEKIGLKDNNGAFNQLNTNILQIDNEFYSNLRPKRTSTREQSALMALHAGGVEYIEVRLMDLNPYAPEGISENDLKFVQLFLIYCLATESPVIEKKECDIIENNFLEVVNNGRSPSSFIIENDVKIRTYDAALKLLDNMSQFLSEFSLMSSHFKMTLTKLRESLVNRDELISQKMMNALGSNTSFSDHILANSKENKKALQARPIDRTLFESLSLSGTSSFVEEKELASKCSGSFEDFLINYFEQIRIKG